MDWVEDYGVPKEFKVGSTEHWLRKIKQMEPKRKRKFAEEFSAYNPPQAAVNNAKRGLKLREKWGRGGMSPAEARKAGIDSGVTRAKKISSGSVSRHDVRRMSAFNRHRKNYAPSKKKPDGGPTAGTIAWLLWGGTSGVDWAKKKSATMNAEGGEMVRGCYPCPNCGQEMYAINSKGFGTYCTCFKCGANYITKPIMNAEQFGAEIRPIDDENSTHKCKYCGTGIYYHTQGQDIGNQPIRETWCNEWEEDPSCGYSPNGYHAPHEGEADGINASYKTSITDEPNLIHFEKAGGTVKIEDATKEMYKRWDKLYLDNDTGLYVGFQAESDSAKLKKYEKTYGKTGAKVRLKLLKSIKGKNIYGTKSGQWSARKSQHLTEEYEKAMKKKGAKPYKSSKRTKAQKSLKKWGDQRWKTKSGKKSSVTGERYLPSKAIDALTEKEYAKTTAAKRKAKKAGKQFSKQPKAIAKKVAAYRAEYKTGTQGPCWDGYKYVGPKPYSSGSCVKNAEGLDIQGNSIKAKVDTLRGGVEAFTYDITQLKEGDLMRDFLKGVINAFQTSIKGVDVAGIDKTLEEITIKFLPNAEMRAELMAQEGYSENEHYHMGEVWGYDEVMNFLSLYQIDFQRQFASEIQNKLQNDTELTKKEVKTIMLYPLIVGFMGGTLATVVGNVLSALYLKRKHGLWNS